jgi:phosphoribosylformylglycinamidine synthase
VQVPDPFLKNVLIRATEAVFKEAKKTGQNVGFKDMGAGGIMCSTTEMCSEAGFGADIGLDNVHTSMDIPPYIIACSETQERFTWIIPPQFTPIVLRIYNEDFELPNVAEGAKASVIGKVTKEQKYVVRHKGEIVCDVPIKEITSGISYERPYREVKRNFKEPEIEEPSDYNNVILKVIGHPNVASKGSVYKHYDTEVQGNAVIRPGEADAGVIAPIEGHPVGVALSTDSNPVYARIDPYMGAVNAVAESMRNVAAVGAVPSGMTDCLCYGNPEKSDVFWQFTMGVKGVADAARNIWLKGTTDPVPVVSGNVSFYNENARGKSVDPSAIIACVGILPDYGKAITMKIKEAGSGIFMIGKRLDELGGSVYYGLAGETGANIPKIDFERERSMIYSVIDMIDDKLVNACHDISDGGLASAVCEMIIGGNGECEIGAEIDLGKLSSDLRTDRLLFSETSGFVLEIPNEKSSRAREICERNGTELIKIGDTGGKTLIVNDGRRNVISIPIEKLKKAWCGGLQEAMR